MGSPAGHSLSVPGWIGSGCSIFTPGKWTLINPRLDVPFLSRIRHYGGLHRTLPRLEHLLTEFRFTSVERAYPEVCRQAQ